MNSIEFFKLKKENILNLMSSFEFFKLKYKENSFSFRKSFNLTIEMTKSWMRMENWK